uniref:SFRICE_002784 n=1 Tax=Spodoptera frugiperda TaxID=7108 RepID=A0A2H1WGD6_SPOFR
MKRIMFPMSKFPMFFEPTDRRKAVKIFGETYKKYFDKPPITRTVPKVTSRVRYLSSSLSFFMYRSRRYLRSSATNVETINNVKSLKTIRERIEQAKNIPEFSTLINHPRFLKMIYYNTTAIKRLNKLYSNNKKCVSLNVLSGSSAHYEIFEKAPGNGVWAEEKNKSSEKVDEKKLISSQI